MIRNCVVCGGVFKCRPSDKIVTCSPACKGTRLQAQMTARNAAIKNIKQCVVCGKDFQAPLSSTKVCCGRNCESQRRSAAALEKLEIHQNALKKGIAASPILQPNENHCNAKEWVLISPAGERFECRNLAHWARENIGEEWKNFRAGISRVLATLLGKTKRPYRHYKGWTVEFL